MTIEDIERRALEAETGRRCALDFARGCKINLQMDFDEADGAFSDCLRRAGKPDEYLHEADHQFPIAWKYAGKPLSEVDPMQEGIELSRRADLSALTFPEHISKDEEKRFWIVLCHLYESYLAFPRKGGFGCPSDRYQRMSNHDLWGTEVNRILKRLSRGRNAALRPVDDFGEGEEGRQTRGKRGGRRTQLQFYMTAEGVKHLPPKPIPLRPPARDAGAGRTCPTALPPVPLRRLTKPPARSGPPASRTCPTGADS